MPERDAHDSGSDPDPDPDRLEEMRERVDDIAEATAHLRELGEREDFPAVERNARRIEGVLAMLDGNLPPELVEDGD